MNLKQKAKILDEITDIDFENVIYEIDILMDNTICLDGEFTIGELRQIVSIIDTHVDGD